MLEIFLLKYRFLKKIYSKKFDKHGIYDWVHTIINQKLGMHRILFFAGYPVRAGYRISGRIRGLTMIFLVKYQTNS
jgi:hypothetical protein